MRSCLRIISPRLKICSTLLFIPLLISCTISRRQDTLPAEGGDSIPIRGEITADVPGELDPNRHYAIFLHGKIIEDQGIDAESPEFGVYEYQAQLAYLADAGVNVISAVRPAGTDPMEYASLVGEQVIGMQASGVPAENISVVGVSKGALIALLVSSRLIDPEVSYVILAVCGDWLSDAPQINLKGRVLSIFEVSDEFGQSCMPLAERSHGIAAFHELSLDTGLGHGAFYRADPDWLDPTVAWITGAAVD